MSSNWRTQVVRPAECRDIAEEGAIDKNGDLVILPLSFWDKYRQEEIALFGHRHAFYNIPTLEQVDALAHLFAGYPALEIGAGSGALARALHIRATDNYMQTFPDIAMYYKAAQQPTIRYGKHVEEADAEQAIKRYKPRVVLGCWITHKYDALRHDLGGNMYGPNEQNVLRLVENYVHIGNAATHRQKPLNSLSHRIYRAPWLVSRSMDWGLNEIRIWGPVMPGEEALQPYKCGG